jgi:hypothetical protein
MTLRLENRGVAARGTRFLSEWQGSGLYAGPPRPSRRRP